MDELRWQDELYDFLKQQGVAVHLRSGCRTQNFDYRSLADPDVNSIARRLRRRAWASPQARTLEARELRYSCKAAG